MAQFKVLQKSFIDNAIREEGDIVEYDGEPGSNLEPLAKPRRARAAADLAEIAEQDPSAIV